jgi:hypothetical protein
MEPGTLVKRLLAAGPSSGPVVTLALSTSGSRILPYSSRMFLKNELEKTFADAAASFGQTVLNALAKRVSTELSSPLRPEHHGMLLVVGAGILERADLAPPVENFLHLGSAPYLAPLLEVQARAPRAYAFQCGRRESSVEECFLGGWQLRETLESPEPAQNAERALTGARGGSGRMAVAGRGGSRKDRYAQTIDRSASAAVVWAAHKIARLQERAPAVAIYAAGPLEEFRDFCSHLPEPLRPMARHLGVVPARSTETFRRRVAEELVHHVRDRVAGELKEFQERRAQGHLVAVGPAEVFAHLDTGDLARVYLESTEPVPGLKCGACFRRYERMQEACGRCGFRLLPVSLTQEIVHHSLTHPPLALTFLPRPAPWLVEIGGMAALLSAKGQKTKKT